MAVCRRLQLPADFAFTPLTHNQHEETPEEGDRWLIGIIVIMLTVEVKPYSESVAFTRGFFGPQQNGKKKKKQKLVSS